MTGAEVRLERLHPTEIAAAMEAAPIAWVPLGALEFHAQHLPIGTDGFAAQALVERAAASAGGVVLPWSAVTLGTLHLPWTFRYDRSLVEGVLRQTIEQLAEHGTRVVVVHTGHAPLDLIHLIKRVCAEVEASGRHGPDFRAYGLCYLELNAARGAGLGSDWPVAVDHGSITETSWMLAIEPQLVHVDRLPRGSSFDVVGVYGPDPRGRASGELGTGQLDGCARLLAERAGRLLAGERIDPLADLREFVARYWPEPLELAGRTGRDAKAVLDITNPGPVSRYLTSLTLSLDGVALEGSDIELRNATVGEAGATVAASSLAPESGFYIRRGQSAEARLPVAADTGPHDLTVTLGLAGVTTVELSGRVQFA